MLDHYTTPGESIEIRDDQTIYSLLTERLARTGADTVIAAKKIGPGRWQNVTTGEFHERVVSAAKGLIALGIAKGDAVTIFSSTRLEWGILDFALAAVGAVSVPIYDTDSAPQAQRIMNDSAVKLAFADNRERFDRLDSVKDHCPALKQILMIEGNALGALEGLGVAVSDEELNERVATVRAKYETLVYRTVRGALGPKIKYVACGGAPLSLDLAHFYNGIGLPMIQGYGMTETAAPFAATRVTDNVIGTVGQPAPGSSIRISDEGELQVKGPNVFRGYHNLPEKTAEAFTADGWLRTGDLAEIDDEGHIVITGRIKDIIITAGGKNVSPIPLEEEIAKCPIVEHCVVVGDQRPFIGALVTLDPESLALWLPAHGLSTETPVDRLATNAAVREEIQQYVDKANATVSRAESVRKFAVLDTQFTQENKCLTPSLKVVRPAVNRVFADVIDNEIYNGKR